MTLVLKRPEAAKSGKERFMQGLALTGQAIPELIESHQKSKEKEAFRKQFGIGGQEGTSPEASAQGQVPEKVGGVPKVTGEHLMQAATDYPEYLAPLTEIYKTQHAEGVEERKAQRESLKAPLEEARVKREQLAGKKISINAFKGAVQEGVGPFSVDNAARIFNETLGTEVFRQGMSGAQLGVAAKNNLIESLDRVGAKGLNQFLEKQISLTNPLVGASEEANLSTIANIEASYDIQKFRLDALGDLEDFYNERGMIPPKTIVRDADKATAQYADKRIQQLSLEIKELYERGKTDAQVMNLSSKGSPKKVINGTPLTDRNAQLFVDKYGEEDAAKVAKSLGYDIEYHGE